MNSKSLNISVCLIITAILQCIWAQVVLDARISVVFDICYVFPCFSPHTKWWAENRYFERFPAMWIYAYFLNTGGLPFVLITLRVKVVLIRLNIQFIQC